ncbi:MAG: hypothetical protein HKM88_06875 [Halobacteria archaeon]|nr:hypothetical protein [Halobacteria archaeon]
MKSDLWIVFAVTAGFMGFMIGYGVPPVQEVGLYAMGHGGAAGVEESAETDAAMEQFKELEDLLK